MTTTKKKKQQQDLPIREIEVGKDGVVLHFTREENGKYSFEVKDDEVLTDLLIADCKKKKVRQDAMFYAIRGLFEKLDRIIIENGFEFEEEPTIGATIHYDELKVKKEQIKGFAIKMMRSVPPFGSGIDGFYVVEWIKEDISWLKTRKEDIDEEED